MVAEYNLAEFSPGLFRQLNIPLDPVVANAVPKRQGEFLAGRLLAMKALGNFGMVSRSIPKSSSGNPIWPQGIRGSITHSNGTVGVWITSNPVDLGLDIESRITTRQAAAIRRVVLTDAEREMGLGDADLTTVFSAKETIFKALYPRVSYRFGFDCAELAARPRRDVAAFRLTRTLCREATAGTTLEVRTRWIGDQVLTQCRVPAT